LTFEQLKDSLKMAVADNADAIVGAELQRIASSARISVNGRYGQFEATSGKIVAPSGATSTTVAGLPLQ
jgi:hypothetical protein